MAGGVDTNIQRAQIDIGKTLGDQHVSKGQVSDAKATAAIAKVQSDLGPGVSRSDISAAIGRLYAQRKISEGDAQSLLKAANANPKLDEVNLNVIASHSENSAAQVRWANKEGSIAVISFVKLLGVNHTTLETGANGKLRHEYRSDADMSREALDAVQQFRKEWNLGHPNDKLPEGRPASIDAIDSKTRKALLVVGGYSHTLDFQHSPESYHHPRRPIRPDNFLPRPMAEPTPYDLKVAKESLTGAKDGFPNGSLGELARVVDGAENNGFQIYVKARGTDLPDPTYVRLDKTLANKLNASVKGDGKFAEEFCNKLGMTVPDLANELAPLAKGNERDLRGNTIAHHQHWIDMHKAPRAAGPRSFAGGLSAPEFADYAMSRARIFYNNTSYDDLAKGSTPDSQKRIDEGRAILLVQEKRIAMLKDKERARQQIIAPMALAEEAKKVVAGIENIRGASDEQLAKWDRQLGRSLDDPKYRESAGALNTLTAKHKRILDEMEARQKRQREGH